MLAGPWLSRGGALGPRSACRRWHCVLLPGLLLLLAVILPLRAVQRLQVARPHVAAAGHGGTPAALSGRALQDEGPPDGEEHRLPSFIRVSGLKECAGDWIGAYVDFQRAASDVDALMYVQTVNHSFLLYHTIDTEDSCPNKGAPKTRGPRWVIKWWLEDPSCEDLAYLEVADVFPPMEATWLGKNASTNRPYNIGPCTVSISHLPREEMPPTTTTTTMATKDYSDAAHPPTSISISVEAGHMCVGSEFLHHPTYDKTDAGLDGKAYHRSTGRTMYRNRKFSFLFLYHTEAVGSGDTAGSGCEVKGARWVLVDTWDFDRTCQEVAYLPDDSPSTGPPVTGAWQVRCISKEGKAEFRPLRLNIRVPTGASTTAVEAEKGTAATGPSNSQLVPPASSEHIVPTSPELARPMSSEHAVPASSEHIVPTSPELARPMSSEHAAPAGSEHIVPTSPDLPRPISSAASSEHIVPTSPELPRPMSSEHAVPASSEHIVPTSPELARPMSSEHAVPASSEHIVPTSPELTRPMSSEHAAPASSEHIVPTSPELASPTSSGLAAPRLIRVSGLTNCSDGWPAPFLDFQRASLDLVAKQAAYVQTVDRSFLLYHTLGSEHNCSNKGAPPTRGPRWVIKWWLEDPSCDDLAYLEANDSRVSPPRRALWLAKRSWHSHPPDFTTCMLSIKELVGHTPRVHTMLPVPLRPYSDPRVPPASISIQTASGHHKCLGSEFLYHPVYDKVDSGVGDAAYRPSEGLATYRNRKFTYAFLFHTTQAAKPGCGGGGARWVIVDTWDYDRACPEVAWCRDDSPALGGTEGPPPLATWHVRCLGIDGLAEFRPYRLSIQDVVAGTAAAAAAGATRHGVDVPGPGGGLVAPEPGQRSPSSLVPADGHSFERPDVARMRPRRHHTKHSSGGWSPWSLVRAVLIYGVAMVVLFFWWPHLADGQADEGMHRIIDTIDLLAFYAWGEYAFHCCDHHVFLGWWLMTLGGCLLLLVPLQFQKYVKAELAFDVLKVAVVIFRRPRHSDWVVIFCAFVTNSVSGVDALILKLPAVLTQAEGRARRAIEPSGPME